MVVGVGILAFACDGDLGSLEFTTVRVNVAVTSLRPLDGQTEGAYEAWVIGSDGVPRSMGRFIPPPDGKTTSLNSPIANPTELMITVEPPGDIDQTPSPSRLLGGRFSGGAAALSIVRYVTGVSELETDPGHHALFTPSNNPELSFPSFEDAGIWLFAPRPSETVHNSHFIWLTPLTAGWTYEGWIVQDYGTLDACWLSYGKFRPDEFRLVNTRDDTGLGIFSGQFDYENAMVETVDMPGDDWVANPHGVPIPCGLTLPLDLNGDAEQEIPSRWTHVISIEPLFDQGEDPLSPRPFGLQPYRNPFGDGAPNEGRVIEYHRELVPTGSAVLER